MSSTGLSAEAIQSLKDHIKSTIVEILPDIIKEVTPLITEIIKELTPVIVESTKEHCTKHLHTVYKTSEENKAQNERLFADFKKTSQKRF